MIRDSKLLLVHKMLGHGLSSFNLKSPLRIPCAARQITAIVKVLQLCVCGYRKCNIMMGFTGCDQVVFRTTRHSVLPSTPAELIKLRNVLLNTQMGEKVAFKWACSNKKY